jgi:hypothetical protein
MAPASAPSTPARQASNGTAGVVGARKSPVSACLRLAIGSRPSRSQPSTPKGAAEAADTPLLAPRGESPDQADKRESPEQADKHPATSPPAPTAIGVPIDGSEDTDVVGMLRKALAIDQGQKDSIKATVAKALICIVLSRSWGELIVLLRPLAFGLPLDIGHQPSCPESASILLVTLAAATLMLYGLTKLQSRTRAGKVNPVLNKVVQGLGASTCFMWAGAAFMPSVLLCFSLIDMNRWLLGALAVVLGAGLSLAVLSAQEELQNSLAASRVQAGFRGKRNRLSIVLGQQVNGQGSPEAGSPVPGSHGAEAVGGSTAALGAVVLEVIAQGLPLLSVFIVLSTAKMVDKISSSALAWRTEDYMRAYLSMDPGVVRTSWEEGAAGGEGGHVGGDVRRRRLAVSELSGEVDLWLPNPAVVSILWALAANGLLTRLATTLAVTIGPALERAQKKGLVMLVVFAIQLCAYYSGFQYLDAVAASWKVTLKDPGAPGLHMLVAECLTVVAFAVLYIKIGGVISGIKTLPKEKVRTR